MKKKILQIIILVFSFSLLLAIKPIVAKAEDVPVTTNKTAIDVESQQLLDGTGYFKKTNYSAEFTFYYTNYNGTDVDYTTNESLYVRTINKSVIPSNWYNESTGLDLESFESISIIQGKWALPKEYVTDFKGNIIPNSTGYLQESVYSDCRRYVYYITYKNEDGVQRPVYTKHYECDVEVDKIPSYLLSDDKKNEKMGILYGSIHNTSLLTYKAVKNIEYFSEVKLFTTEYLTVKNKLQGEYKYRNDWYPVIYFNIDDVDYDILLSVEFEYTYAQYKKEFVIPGLIALGDYVKVENSTKKVTDEVFFEESLDYVAERDSPLVITTNLTTLYMNKDCNFERLLNEKEYFKNNHSKYKLLESGSWFKDGEYTDSNGETHKVKNKEFFNRIIGHSFSSEDTKKFKIVKDGVQLVSIVYMYDGVIYCSDQNVIINGIDYTPDLPTTEGLINDAIDKLMTALGNVAGTVVNTTGQGFLTLLKEFFSSLSPAVWAIIIIVSVVFLLTITRSLWMPLLTKKTLKDDRLVDQSFKMQNRHAYNRSENKRRRWTNEDKKYYDKRYKKRRKDMLSDRDFMTERVDKKYAHEQSIQDKRDASYQRKYAHEQSMQDKRDASYQRKYAHEQSMQDKRDASYQRKYAHEQSMQDKRDASYRKKYAHEKYLLRKRAEGYSGQNEKRKNKTPWFDDYLKKEKQKMKNKKQDSSDESLEDLDAFFNSRK